VRVYRGTYKLSGAKVHPRAVTRARRAGQDDAGPCPCVRRRKEFRGAAARRGHADLPGLFRKLRPSLPGPRAECLSAAQTDRLSTLAARANGDVFCRAGSGRQRPKVGLDDAATPKKQLDAGLGFSRVASVCRGHSRCQLWCLMLHFAAWGLTSGVVLAALMRLSLQAPGPVSSYYGAQEAGRQDESKTDTKAARELAKMVGRLLLLCLSISLLSPSFSISLHSPSLKFRLCTPGHQGREGERAVEAQHQGSPGAKAPG